MSTVCITSFLSVGGSFVDWSVHYLAGKDQYYRIAEQCWTNLTSNPLTSTNAHDHNKNHPAGSVQTGQYLQQINRSEQLTSMYACPLPIGAALEQLKITQPTNAQLPQLKDLILKDYQQLIECVYNHDTKLIYIDSDVGTELYHIVPRTRHLLDSDSNALPQPGVSHDRPHVIQTDYTYSSSFQQLFFNQSLAHWHTNGLVEIWDVRERLALDLRPFDLWGIGLTHLNFSKPHQWVSCKELWSNGPDVLFKIMSWIDQPVNQERWVQWLQIYNKWQQIQFKAAKFTNTYKHILDCVINNWYYEIDLSFEQEVIIQHCLIYNHGLNLKTWQLKKFPSNTKDLHSLLEQNFHVLPV